MNDPKTVKLLLDCMTTIEQNIQSKGGFMASSQLQDKVLSSLHELSGISRSISWGYRGMLTLNMKSVGGSLKCDMLGTKGRDSMFQRSIRMEMGC